MRLFSGSNDLLASSLFKDVYSIEDFGSRSWSVAGALLELFLFELALLEASVDIILEAFLWRAFVSSAIHDLSIQQAPEHAIVLHEDDMPHPSELSLC